MSPIGLGEFYSWRDRYMNFLDGAQMSYDHVAGKLVDSGEQDQRLEELLAEFDSVLAIEAWHLEIVEYDPKIQDIQYSDEMIAEEYKTNVNKARNKLLRHLEKTHPEWVPVKKRNRGRG